MNPYTQRVLTGRRVAPSPPHNRGPVWRGLVWVGLLAGGGFFLLRGDREERSLSGSVEEMRSEAETAVAALPAGATTRVLVDTLKAGESLSHLFTRHGLSPRDLAAVVRATRPLLDLRRLRPSAEVRVFLDATGQLDSLRYALHRDATLVVVREPDRMAARVEETPFDRREVLLGGVITSSLYEGVLAVGGDPQLAFEFADLFGWQIDFATEIQPEDAFTVLYEANFRPDGTSRMGRILGARLVSRGQAYWGIYFHDPEGRADYFDLRGESLRRQFLRSPLRYRAISSRFSRRRFHPILSRYLPHYGVDYAAPLGTPVRTVADGVVLAVGWRTGHGRRVKIRHPGGYTSTYSHLSRYARGLRAGQQVTQGQAIGYVGSSGLSTGPHLDYRLFKHGRPVNPLTVDLPPARAVRPGARAAFREQRDRVAARLNGEDPRIANQVSAERDERGGRGAEH